MKRLCILILGFSFSAPASEFVIWNVGQGQWTTEVHKNFCLHMDLGGEKDVSHQVQKLCRGKKQYLHLSHWDQDHISFAVRFASLNKQSCLLNIPEGNPSEWKRRMISQIRLCPSRDLEFLKEFQVNIFAPQSDKKISSNDLSSVTYLTNSKVLIPGDSTKKQEKHWAGISPKNTRGLVLGHHGSYSSTSDYLLDHLPNLKWAVATARKKRYGHPHIKVLQRLQIKKIPILRTEDWGNIHFL